MTHSNGKRLSLCKDEDTNVSLFAKWINENVYEMIAKKYLKTLHMSISKANPDGTMCVENALQERYSLRYEYCDNGEVNFSGKAKNRVMVEHTKDKSSFNPNNITKEVRQMIRNIVGINATLKPLPQHILVSIEIEFTESTPKSYKTKHFIRCSSDDMPKFCEGSQNASNETWKLNLGSMDTKHVEVGLNIEVVEGDVKVKVVSDILREKRRKCTEKNAQPKNHTPRVNCFQKGSDEHEDAYNVTDMQILDKDDESQGIDARNSVRRRRDTQYLHDICGEGNNAEVIQRALLIFSKQKRSKKRSSGITSVSALRSLLKLKNMKESQQLCTFFERHGVLSSLGKSGRTTSYKIESDSSAFARLSRVMKMHGEADDDDSPTDCEDLTDVESGRDSVGNLSHDEHTERHRTKPYRNLISKKRKASDYARVKSPIHITPDHSILKSGNRSSRRFKSNSYFDQSETF